MIENNKDKQFINYNTFLGLYEMKSISQIRIKRTAKKSYLVLIITLYFLFFLLYLTAFSWQIVFIHSAIHLVCFAFINQYDYSITFLISNQNFEYNLYTKEKNLFYQIKKEYYNQHNLTFYYKNEPSFKGNFRSQQFSS